MDKPLCSRVTVAEIMAVVAAFYDLPLSELKGKSRSRLLVRPRQIVAFLAKELTPRSFPEIGKIIGRDHSTVVHSRSLIEHMIGYDPVVAEDVELLRAFFTERGQLRKAGPEEIMQANREAAQQRAEEAQKRAEEARKRVEARKSFARMEALAAVPKVEEFFRQKEIEKAQREMADDEFISFMLDRGYYNDRWAA